MTSLRIRVDDMFPTKAAAVARGREMVNGTGRTSKLFSQYKKYEVKKIGKLWRLYLIKKSTYEMLHGKPYRGK